MSSHPAPRARSVLEQRDPAWAREFEAILQAYEQAGGRAGVLQTPKIASAVISRKQLARLGKMRTTRLCRFTSCW